MNMRPDEISKPSQSYSGGRRLAGVSPWKSPEQPTISVVTVVFNGKAELLQTLRSVQEQTYPNVEYIVIDGGSTDGTLDALKDHSQDIDFWISERDNGIYDAFNKGSRSLTGEWTIFLGAGDVLRSKDVLSEIAHAAATVPPGTEILYGQVAIVTTDGRLVEIENEAWSESKGKWSGGRPMIPHHQGVFHHRTLFMGDAPFDTSYRICADSKLVIQSILKHEPQFARVVVTSSPLGGISTQPKYALLRAKEVLRVNREVAYRNVWNERFFYAKTLAKVLLQKFGGEHALKRATDLYRRATGRTARWDE